MSALTVEGCLKLDSFRVGRLMAVRKAVRTGQVVPGTWTFTWKGQDDSPRGHILVSLIQFGWGPAVELQYTASSGDNPTDLRYAVPLAVTPTQFGGKRVWFTCQGGRCGGRRARFLYLVGMSFRCRICHQLTYMSRQHHRHLGTELLLIERRQDALQARLSRARSARRIAYLRNKIEALEERSNALFSLRLFGRLA